MAWTELQKQELRELWNTKLSAKEIATRLGGGITKNAVIGMSNRMKLPMRRIKSGKPIRKDRPLPERKAPQPPKPRAKRPSPSIVPSEPSGPLGGVFIDKLRPTSCRAIIGAERPPEGVEPMPKYCGGTTLEDKSWCPHHFALYTQPPRR